MFFQLVGMEPDQFDISHSQPLCLVLRFPIVNTENNIYNKNDELIKHENKMEKAPGNKPVQVKLLLFAS